MTFGKKATLLDRLSKLRDSIQGKEPSSSGPAKGPRPDVPRGPGAERDRDGTDEAIAQEEASSRGPIRPADDRSARPNAGGRSREDVDADLDEVIGRLGQLAPALLRSSDPGVDANDPYAKAARRKSASVPRSAPPGPPASPTSDAAPASTSEIDLLGPFFPEQPKNFIEAGLNNGTVEELILKYLLATGEATGQCIAEQIKLPFPLIAELLGRMKSDQTVQYRGTTTLNDYVCSLTEMGRERARRHSMRCTYFGAAPVTLSQYRESVEKQSLLLQNPSIEDLKRAFSDLLVNPKMLTRLGAAMNSGRGMFLYGYPGNGKTSIAERVTRAFGQFIWIPRSIAVDGEIIRLFDPIQHEEAPLPTDGELLRQHHVDERWVRIRRPTIIVGGELTMANLELSTNAATGINEAPVQLKSNCGTLVIDDFGRQRMSVNELLNRWIVPLEKRVDFLNMPSGKKVQVPFDQLVVFSTNLEPKDLVDDAFLRRIPYKINVENPSEAEFRSLFRIMCERMNIPHSEEAIDYLIETHYRPTDRPFRCCHPRDLLLQINNFCKYTRQPAKLTHENFDFAADNYFSIM